MFTKENGFALPGNWQFPDGKKYVFTFISLLIILLAIYSNSFYGDWHFDDLANIVENPHIQINKFSWESIKNCIYGLAQEKPSRPLSYLSFALNYQFNGLDVFGYHIVNFLIHYLSAVFLFLFIINILRLPILEKTYGNIAYPVALLSTLFWAINPVGVTSVTYIVQRMASMAGLFYIMSMYFYLKARTQDKFSHSIILFSFCFISGLAAVLSKENAAMLPLCILIYDLFIIQGLNKENIKKFFKYATLPFVVILIIGFIYTDFSSVLGGYEIRDFTMMQRLLTEPRVILFYLSLLFYPINSRLTLLYDIDVSRSLFQPWTTIPAILLIAIIIGFAFYIAKKRPLISFCIIFYFLNHIIEGSIFSLELIYEHRNYLPSMLLFIIPSFLIIHVFDYFSYKKTIQFACALGVIIILTGLGDITYRRNAIVSDDFTLWYDNAEKYPNLSRNHSNLGNAYIHRQQRDKALIEYEKAMQLNNFGSIHARAIQEYNLGLYKYNEGKYNEALAYFEISSKVLPFYITHTCYIAKIHLLKNQYTEAHRLIEAELTKYPFNDRLSEIFCLILMKENNLEEAGFYAKTSLKNNIANTFSLPVLAEISRKKGNFRAAISLWNLYQQSFPFDPHANLALIELYAQTKDLRMLDNELRLLNALKGNKDIVSYIKEIAQKENLLIYVPDIRKTVLIAKERYK
jgi:tetratricopeptide (TPR) repeat protein